MKTMIYTPIERRNARAVPDEIEKKQSENGVVHNEQQNKKGKSNKTFFHRVRKKREGDVYSRGGVLPCCYNEL